MRRPTPPFSAPPAISPPSGGNTPHQLLTVQRLADFPARADYRDHKIKMDLFRKEMSKERLEIQKKRLALTEKLTEARLHRRDCEGASEVVGCVKRRPETAWRCFSLFSRSHASYRCRSCKYLRSFVGRIQVVRGWYFGVYPLELFRILYVAYFVRRFNESREQAPVRQR
jgi:hypothetical protein